MRRSLATAVLCAIAWAASGSLAQGKTLNFAGHTWSVKSGADLGPGPNDWDAGNVFVDQQGDLHLKLTHRGGRWQCAQVVLKDRLGYGRYQFFVIGRLDKLDPNVVFGIFSYPTPDVGPDRTNEIDLEFAKWGKPPAKIGNYTVWPALKGLKPANTRYAIEQHGNYTTHRYTWTPTSIFFQSLYGRHDDNTNQFASWLYRPADPATALSSKAMPLEINLWLFQGRPPLDGQEVEIVVHSFTFTPAP